MACRSCRCRHCSGGAHGRLGGPQAVMVPRRRPTGTSSPWVRPVSVEMSAWERMLSEVTGALHGVVGGAGLCRSVDCVGKVGHAYEGEVRRRQRRGLEIINRHEPGDPAELEARLSRVFAHWLDRTSLADSGDLQPGLRKGFGQGRSDHSSIDSQAA
jgi:hypothetical protein